jgi:hypothetical protein
MQDPVMPGFCIKVSKLYSSVSYILQLFLFADFSTQIILILANQCSQILAGVFLFVDNLH